MRTAVENLTLRNSAFWMQRYFSCDHVRLSGLTVWNHANLNNDGLDIDSSQNVLVSHCRCVARHRPALPWFGDIRVSWIFVFPAQ